MSIEKLVKIKFLKFCDLYHLQITRYINVDLNHILKYYLISI